LCADHAKGDAWPAVMFAAPEDAAVLESARHDFLDSLLADMLGFAACKMVRRIVGFAHVIDFDRIADANRRAQCEAAALAMARRLLTHPQDFRSIDDVLDAVPHAR
jgi:5-methylthioribose kinase